MYTYKVYFNKSKLVVLCVVFSFSVVCFYILNGLPNNLSTPKEAYQICIEKNENQEIEDCLKKAIAESYANYSVEYIGLEFQNLTTNLENKWCHQTMHYLGGEVYRGKSSLPIAFSFALDTCDSGMYHGIVEAFLYENGTTGNIPQLLQNLCEEGMRNSSTFFEGYLSLCYHGLGHGLMLVTAHNLEQSLNYCDLVIADSSNQCRNGVYMEYTNNHAEDTKVIDMHLCAEIEENQKSYCFNRYGNQSLGNANGDVDIALDSCELIPSVYKENCQSGVAEAIRFEKGAEVAALDCLQLTDHEVMYSRCITSATSFYARIDRGEPTNLITFCNFFQNGNKKVCITKARDALEEWPTTEEGITALCIQLQKQEDQVACLLGVPF